MHHDECSRDSSPMRRRRMLPPAPLLARAAAVVLALLFVAVGCLRFEPPSHLPPDPGPLPSSVFAGCFTGEVIGRDAAGSVALVLESDEGPDPDFPLRFQLRGCMDWDFGDRDETIVVTGRMRGPVLDQEGEVLRERAEITGLFNDGTPIALEIVRSPDGVAIPFLTEILELCEESFESLGCPATLSTQ